MRKVYVVIFSLFFVFGTLKISADNKEQLVDFKGNPDKYELNQNYPNPFNPATTIRFSIPIRSHVSVKVFDILGNEVATVLNETKESGSYSLEFDGTSLVSGIYVYRFVAGNFTESRKMLLLK